MANVIREDVIKLGFDIDLKDFNKLKEDVEELKKKLGGVDDSTSEAEKGLDKMRNSAKKLASGLVDLGEKAAKKAFNGLKKIAGVSFKALMAGVGAAATAIAGLVAKSVSAYADFEQLKGGVETLFGAKGAQSVEDYAKIMGKSVDKVKGEFNKLKEVENTVIKNANNAFKSSGLSANDYMETVTSFSASLISSVKGDTKQAAKLADMAIVDMSDNANKMGSDMATIQTAYQGFAKQNYTMLDNLKLGYGGTKTEMERLIKDAAKMDKSVKKNDMSYANIVKAIHAVQDSLYITGTTQKEAEGTITGSLGMVKAAWGNLMPALIQGGDTFDQCVDNLIYSVDKFSDNIMPAMEKALGGVGQLIEKLAPKFAEKFPALAQKLIPPLVKAAVDIVRGLIKALPTIIKTLAQSIVDIFGEQFPIIKKIGNFFTENSNTIASSIKTLIPVVLGLVAAFKGFSAYKSLSSIFGGKDGGGKEGGGLFGGITNTFKTLAKTKSSVILKGMANLGIILGGFTILAAAFAIAAPYIARFSDLKSIVEFAAIMAVLGGLGKVLTPFVKTAGKMKVTQVLKGLANIAIIIGGTALMSVILGFATMLPFDYGKILKFIGLIGVLGTVGSVLAVFAGLIGLVPIPVVLAGLANIALVINGFALLVAEFAALNKISGFKQFMESGGELLCTLFNILGKVVGSVIGGVAQGITNSLPKIGENLSAFANSLKPMFTAFQGVNLEGASAFLSAIGGLMLKMAGNKILEFFAGSPDFSGVANGLGTLATSEGVTKFFNMVNTIPQEAFGKGKSFFEVMDGISSLPNVGGLGQLFSGTNDFVGTANGLGRLAGEGVKNFFTMVSGIAVETFDKAKQFFECMDGISNLPNSGGLGQLFSGKNDFAGVASGLDKLSSEGVQRFFKMVAGLDAATFTKTKDLFTALADISNVGEQGFWSKVGDAITGSGDDPSGIEAVANQLSNFAKKTTFFFAKVKELNLSKLNGMWTSLNKGNTLTVKLSDKIDDNITNIVDKIKEMPKKMGDALKSGGENLASAFVTIWKDAIEASVAPVNKLLGGANHLLTQFGSNKKLLEWTPYARGTGGHKGGNALVNDGRGAELIQMPNGRMFIPNGRNVFLPNAPKGMKVLPANQTAQLMGRKSPTFRYAGGVGELDIWSYYDNPNGLANAIADQVSYKGMSGFVLSLGKSMVSTFQGEMGAWVQKLFEEGGQGIGSYIASKGVMQWLPTVARALKMEGQYSVGNVARTLFQMNTESGGNPHAINLWDKNAKNGTPSKGLMQVIDPTFNAYARKGFDKNIYDPLSNILASVRYATSRYGSLSKAYRGVGYANGVGSVTIPNQPNTLSFSYTPESSFSGGRAVVNEHNTYAPVFNLTISGNGDERAMERKVKRWIGEAMDEVFAGMQSKNPRLREV